MSTGLVHDARFQLHLPATLAERPQRTQAIYDKLASSGLLDQLVAIAPAPAPLAALRRVHTPAYLRRARMTCQALADGETSILDEEDVIVCRQTWETALLAAGGAMALCDAVMQGRVDNGFANIRPPGHHAERGRAMGFCILANAAIVARHLQDQYGLKKIAIVDWDVHHGNGTQHIFESDPSVLFISLHQHPDHLYPGTGYRNERGKGKGRGFTLNLPMLPGAGDDAFQSAFIAEVLPALRKFSPQAILISAGFDAHAGDPLAQLELSTAAYGWMTRQLKAIAQECACGRLISLLEGGYNLKNLADSVHAHIKVLVEG